MNNKFPTFHQAVMAAMTSPRPLAALDSDQSTHQEEIRSRWPGMFNGIAVPWGDPEARSMSVSTFAHGGALVGSAPVSMLGAIRNTLSLERLGALVLVGLSGDVSIGYGSTKVTAEWLSEKAQANLQTAKFRPLALSPKRITAKFSVTRQLLTQVGPMLETYLRTQAGAAISAELERVAVEGSGAAPVGILNVNGVNVVTGGSNGAAPTWDHVTALEHAVSDSDADDGSTGWLVSPLVRRKLRRTARNGTGSAMIWDGGPRDLLGHFAGISRGVPDDLTKGTSTNCSAIVHGAWSQYAIGIWGPGIDVTVDPYTRADEGLVVITVNLHVDSGVIDPKGFAVMPDALAA